MALPSGKDALNEHLDLLISEHRAATKDTARGYDTWLKMFRGKSHWPDKRPQHRIPFVYNKIGKSVKMMAGLMTDSKPVVEVRARANGLEQIAELQTNAIRAIWDEQNFDEKFALRGIPMAAIFGSCPFHIFYDWTLDGGRGDIKRAGQRDRY